MKIVSKGAVLIIILMIKLTYKQSRGSTDFIHWYCEDDMKWLCDTLDFTENVVTESSEFTSYYKGKSASEVSGPD